MPQRLDEGTRRYQGLAAPASTAPGPPGLTKPAPSTPDAPTLAAPRGPSGEGRPTGSGHLLLSPWRNPELCNPGGLFSALARPIRAVLYGTRISGTRPSWSGVACTACARPARLDHTDGTTWTWRVGVEPEPVIRAELGWRNTL